MGETPPATQQSHYTVPGLLLLGVFKLNLPEKLFSIINDVLPRLSTPARHTGGIGDCSPSILLPKSRTEIMHTQVPPMQKICLIITIRVIDLG